MYLPDSQSDIPLRLSWFMIKQIAVQAYMSGRSFNEYAQAAMQERVDLETLA